MRSSLWYFFYNSLVQKSLLFFQMSIPTFLIVAIATTLLVVPDWSVQAGRLVGQTPLLFGRRGMNPNMNSLFFGKRSDERPAPSFIDQEICDLCKEVRPWPSCELCVKESLLELADKKK